MNNQETVLFHMNEFALTYTNPFSKYKYEAGTRLASRDTIVKVKVLRKVKEPNL